MIGKTGSSEGLPENLKAKFLVQVGEAVDFVFMLRSTEW